MQRARTLSSRSVGRRATTIGFPRWQRNLLVSRSASSLLPGRRHLRNGARDHDDSHCRGKPVTPLHLGVVTNFARPGGNMTGWTWLWPGTHGEAAGTAEGGRSVHCPGGVPRQSGRSASTLQAMETAAKALKLELRLFVAREPDEFDSTFAAMVERRVDAVVVQGDTMFAVNAKAVADPAIKHRLPSAGIVEFAQAGGMIRNWSGPDRRASSAPSDLRGQDTQGRETWGSSHRAGDEISIGDQPEDRQGARAHYSAVATAARGRSNSVMDRRTSSARSLAVSASRRLAAEAQLTGKCRRLGVMESAYPPPRRSALAN